MARFAKWRVGEELCMHLCLWSKGGLELFFSGCTFDMLVEMRSNGFKHVCSKVPGHLERHFWMSIFLFAYGLIHLVECGLSASISLWW